MIPGIFAGAPVSGGGGGGITFLSQTQQVFIGNTTSHAVTLPTVSAGDLLYVAIAASNSAYTVTTPAGWVLERSDYDGAVTAMKVDIYSRICDGSESGTNVDFVTSISTTLHALTMRLSGAASSGYFECSAPSVINNSSNYACPSLSPSWGTSDTFWHSLHFGNNGPSVSQWPLPDNQALYPSQDFCRIYTSTEIENTATKTPNNMVLSGSQYAVVYTIGVKPA